MGDRESLIRNISDTALWAAAYRALESDRPDAVFRDRFARRLAGERGEKTMKLQPGGTRHAWAWVSRTWLFDQFIAQQIREGVDAVINLAAGLDTRPYRMDLPGSFKWIEVDLPDLLAYKHEVMKDERPRCDLETVSMDLADVDARRILFGRVAAKARNVLILTEGILIYLTESEVSALAHDLGRHPSIRRWVAEITSPGLLRLLQREVGGLVRQGGAEFKFGPEQGPDFFTPLGWRPIEVRSLLKAGARIRRLPLFMRLIATLPEARKPPASRPWSGVCLFERT